jgi:nucleoside-diphosphate kinase
MAIEHTLSIIKPDAVQRQLIGAIYTRFESAGLSIIAAKMIRLTRKRAENFYAIHREKSFFSELVKQMSSGPIMVQILCGEDAIQLNRTLMGATDPSQATAGTIRADFALSIDKNSVHGSDSAENAIIEINFFFHKNEIHNTFSSI